MKAMKITYWITTSLVSLGLLAGGTRMLMQDEMMIAQMMKLGYPVYALTILGLAKVLAPVALMVPRFPRLKEWAYAGAVFLYIGAAWSHFAADDAAGSTASLASMLVLIASYVLYRRIRAKQPATALNTNMA